MAPRGLPSVVSPGIPAPTPHIKSRSDLLGAAVNWGSPPGNTLRDQTTVETFWRLQYPENLAITHRLQLLLDPAQDPMSDEVWVLGLRARLTF